MRKPITLAIAAAIVGASAATTPMQSLFAAAATTYKVIAPKNALTSADAELLQDYGAFALYRTATPSIASAKGVLAASTEMDVLQFSAQPFDTQRGTLNPPAPFSL